MNIFMYFYVEDGCRSRYRVFRLKRQGDSLHWVADGFFWTWEQIELYRKGAVRFPFKGRGSEMTYPYNEEEFQRALGEQ